MKPKQLICPEGQIGSLEVVKQLMKLAEPVKDAYHALRLLR
jgi:hypothetical protein